MRLFADCGFYPQGKPPGGGTPLTQNYFPEKFSAAGQIPRAHMKAISIIGLSSLLLLGAASSLSADLVPVPDLGLRVERGFQVTLFADNNLAPDTWCMTTDANGRVVVGNGLSIRTLHDDNNDGVADRAVEFARVERGVMGLCFDGNSLYAVADGWLERFDDANGDGVADGPPTRLLPIGFGEHGGHAIRQGPDGWWYVVGGNDSAFTAEKHVTLDGSPILRPEAGALLRLTPEGDQSEIIAHGFRNPYDFDFNAAGDLFIYDSDAESDAFLPWYAPTRVYDVGYGQHHGWRLTGYKRSWPRPDYYNDTVPILARVGRGSPTGVACYRHFQFPEAYQGGLFLADWTFGRIYYLPLDANGASYTRTEPQVFIEPIGTQGFAPTDLAVGPDGSLFVSIGGRKTRGAIYRVQHSNTPAPAPSLLALLPNADLNNVLAAPQPLAAWSRALWKPAATRLGVQPFNQIFADESADVSFRIRAIEVLTEMFGGVPAARIRTVVRSSVPEVRARLAWSLGRTPGQNAVPVLLDLALDGSATVRRAALDAIADQIHLFTGASLVRVAQDGLNHADKYVRLAAARVASRLDQAAWEQLTTAIPPYSAGVNSAAVAQAWRTPDLQIHPEMIPALTNLLALNRDPLVRADAVRLIIYALGDWHWNSPAIEVNTGYENPALLPNEFNVAALRRATRDLIPSRHPQLDQEAARLLAMLEDDDARTPRTFLNFITESSSATSDFHYLACLARLRAVVPELSGRVASAILVLDRKLDGQSARVKQNWNLRLVEVVQQLVRHDPALADALLRHPQLATSRNVFLAQIFEGDRKITAARRFLAAAKADATFPWTPELVSLLSLLPAAEVTPYFRYQWANVSLRDELLPRLAEKPVPVDRPKFLAALSSTQPAVVRTSLGALLQLPADPTGTNLIAPLRLLHRSLAEPSAQPVRALLVTLLATNLKQNFKIEEPATRDAATLRRTYQPIFDYVGRTYPGLIRALSADDQDDPLKWNALWPVVPWVHGDATRGAVVFEQRSCAACHGQAGAIGPDLAGAAQRFSREDLMNSVVFPSRDIAPPYRTTTFRLRNGETHTGLVAFESADGWIVQTGAGTSVRVNSAEVVSRQPGHLSVMPAGLLNGLKPQDLADLYAYLARLTAK